MTLSTQVEESLRESGILVRNMKGKQLIDGALRDEENKPMERIATALTFIDITMGMIEKNFNETISKNLTKEELN